MSNLSLFMKKNKVKKENTFYQATKSLLDENSEPLKWEVKPLTTKEDSEIRESCTREVPINGKPGAFRQKVNVNDYMTKMAVASTVFPNLYDSTLQDSYGVKSPEDLIKEMVDDPGEFQEYILFIQNFNGFNTSMNEKVEEAKN